MHWFIFNRKPFYLLADLTPHSYILPVDEAVNILEGIKMYRTACNISPCNTAPLRDSKRILPELVQMSFFPLCQHKIGISNDVHFQWKSK